MNDGSEGARSHPQGSPFPRPCLPGPQASGRAQPVLGHVPDTWSRGDPRLPSSNAPPGLRSGPGLRAAAPTAASPEPRPGPRCALHRQMAPSAAVGPGPARHLPLPCPPLPCRALLYHDFPFLSCPPLPSPSLPCLPLFYPALPSSACFPLCSALLSPPVPCRSPALPSWTRLSAVHSRLPDRRRALPSRTGSRSCRGTRGGSQSLQGRGAVLAEPPRAAVRRGRRRDDPPIGERCGTWGPGFNAKNSRGLRLPSLLAASGAARLPWQRERMAKPPSHPRLGLEEKSHSPAPGTEWSCECLPAWGGARSASQRHAKTWALSLCGGHNLQWPLLSPITRVMRDI